MKAFQVGASVNKVYELDNANTKTLFNIKADTDTDD